MLKIVMDTAGDLPEGWKETYNIDMIPIKQTIDDWKWSPPDLTLEVAREN